MADPLNEDLLEESFWRYDAERKRSGDERWHFKKVMRRFAVEGHTWVETAEEPPEIGEIVLGWWPSAVVPGGSVGLVVRTGVDAWNAPGYYCAEYRAVPVFWRVRPKGPASP